MTKKLRSRIMAIMMILLSFTLIGILIAINIFHYSKVANEENYIAQYYLETKKNTPDIKSGGDTPRNTKPANNSPAQNTETSTDTTLEDTTEHNTENSTEKKQKAPEDKSRSNPPKENKKPGNSKSYLSSDELERLMKGYSIIYVEYSNEHSFLSLERNNADTYTEDEIKAICEKALQANTDTGSIDQLKYVISHSKDGYDIVIMDLAVSRRNNRTLLVYSILFGILGLFIFTFLSYGISNLIVRPVEAAFEQQKDFISAASHELKTPLTVIQANSELLEDQFGHSKWLTYIQAECEQMSKLVTSLLTLTKLDHDAHTQLPFCEFNLSDAFLERILPFESVAFEKQITFNYEITPHITITGIKEQLQQVLTIMLDNAIYHTNSNGEIMVSLVQSNHNITLTVSNTGEPISPEDQKKLFQRFYRADKARSRENGHFGLGLSIAKSIVDQHHGTIDIHCSDGITSFIVSLRNTSSTKESHL